MLRDKRWSSGAGRWPKKAALARYLERRGFSPGSIWGVLDDFEWPADGQ